MKPKPSAQKLRGGYYTPEPIARFISEWSIRSPGARVLEPSCGDGVFLRHVANRLLQLGAKKGSVIDLVRAVEINPEEAEKARRLLRTLGKRGATEAVLAGDFFGFCRASLKERSLFDVVVGNPPFIRYQNFPPKQREVALNLMRGIGLRPNRLTNAWLPFLVGSTLILKEHGRIGMVIPAELLQVNYAAELREFLSTYYRNIVIVTFKRLVFEGIQQEVVLFLGERNGSDTTGIRVVELGDISDLNTYDHVEILESEAKPMDHSKEKWTHYFLDKDEILLLRDLRQDERIKKGRDVLDVDVGVVTGQNSFFILTESKAKALGVRKHAIPIVARSGHLKGIIFRKEDWRNNLRKGLPALLLKAPPKPFEDLSEALRAYIASGEDGGVNGGYKCRIRDPWYTVPSIWTPDGFMLRQIHDHPKIVANHAGATSTDTIHRVRMLNGVDVETVSVAILNSLTFAFSEVLGRSYGGGVLEMYPGEIAELPIPLEGTGELSAECLDKILKEDGIEAVLDITDNTLLIGHLGLRPKQVGTLRGIWRKLRDRRIHRK